MNTLHIQTRQVDEVDVLDLAGRITLGEGSLRLRESLQVYSQQPRARVLLNFSEVQYIDSSGLGELVSAFAAIRRQGGELKLLRLTRKVHDLLQITKLYTVFDIHEDEAEAIAAFV